LASGSAAREARAGVPCPEPRALGGDTETESETGRARPCGEASQRPHDVTQRIGHTGGSEALHGRSIRRPGQHQDSITGERKEMAKQQKAWPQYPHPAPATDQSPVPPHTGDARTTRPTVVSRRSFLKVSSVATAALAAGGMTLPPLLGRQGSVAR